MDIQRVVASFGSLQGKHVADLGCGTGYFTVALAETVGKDGLVSAVDVMEAPLESVRSRLEAMGLHNIQAIRADLEVLGGTKIPDASQDLVLLANTLFQSQKKPAMIAEAVRMLKPGGNLAVIDWKKGAGGGGPPDSLRTDENAMQALAVSGGVRFERAIDVGAPYYGMLFVK